METIQSTEGARGLATKVWESLAEFTMSASSTLGSETTYDPCVTGFLLNAQEWEKLECWLGVVWMTWLPETDNAIEEVERAMKSLFRQKPDAVQKLAQRMEKWSESENKPLPVSFRRICEQAQLDAV